MFRKSFVAGVLCAAVFGMCFAQPKAVVLLQLGKSRVSTMGGLKEPIYDSYSKLHATAVPQPLVTSVALGAAFSVCKGWIRSYQVLLAMYHLNSTERGQEYLNGDPSSNSYDYHLRFQSNRLMLEGRALSRPFLGKLSLLGMLGVGAAYNRASFYDVFSNVTGVQLATRSSTHFAYEAGLGFSDPITSQINVSLLYQYANIGQLRTGDATNFPAGSITPLSLGAHVNTIFLGLSDAFNL